MNVCMGVCMRARLTCPAVYQAARLYDVPALVNFCKTFIAANWVKVTASEAYAALSAEEKEDVKPPPAPAPAPAKPTAKPGKPAKPAKLHPAPSPGAAVAPVAALKRAPAPAPAPQKKAAAPSKRWMSGL